ncbi:MAG: winged helix-turn-helix domain-containing protein [Thermoplasmata archaeon]
MAFEISVVSNVPLTPIEDPREVAIMFLRQIGYLSGGPEGGASAKDLKESIPFKLFADYLLKRMERGWTVEQLSTRLKTTKATVYRHINKLKALDILEEVEVPMPDGPRKGYRIRYGNLSKAWNFVEAHVQVAMEHYRRTVEHLQSLVEGGFSDDKG